MMMRKWCYPVVLPKNEAGFTLLECLVGLATLLLISLSMVLVFLTFADLERRASQAADTQARLELAMEMVLREARQGAKVYGEKLPNAPPSLIIQDEYQGRLRQVRYRLAPDKQGTYSLLREVAYPGISGYQGHNPVIRRIKEFTLLRREDYLELTLEDKDETQITQGVWLRNWQP